MKSAVLLVLAVSACASDPAAHRDKGYSVSGNDPFRFEVDAALLREWGGSKSTLFNQVLERELERRQICRNGYSLRNEDVRGGVFSVTGRCKS